MVHSCGLVHARPLHDAGMATALVVPEAVLLGAVAWPHEVPCSHCVSTGVLRKLLHYSKLLGLASNDSAADNTNLFVQRNLNRRHSEVRLRVVRRRFKKLEGWGIHWQRQRERGRLGCDR